MAQAVASAYAEAFAAVAGCRDARAGGAAAASSAPGSAPAPGGAQLVKCSGYVAEQCCKDPLPDSCVNGLFRKQGGNAFGAAGGGAACVCA